MFFNYFERPYSLIVEFFAGLVHLEIPGVKPYSVSDLEVVRLSASVVEPLHVFGSLFEYHLGFFEYSGHLCYKVSRSFFPLP